MIGLAGIALVTCLSKAISSSRDIAASLGSNPGCESRAASGDACAAGGIRCGVAASGCPGLASSTVRIERHAFAPAARASADALGVTAARIDAIRPASGGVMSPGCAVASAAGVGSSGAL